MTPFYFLGFIFDTICPPAAAIDLPCLSNIPDVRVSFQQLFLILHLISPLLFSIFPRRGFIALAGPRSC